MTATMKIIWAVIFISPIVIGALLAAIDNQRAKQ